MKHQPQPERFVAFAGAHRIASGALAETALAVKQALARDPAALLLVFDGETGHVTDLDLRGDEAVVRARYSAPAAPPAGRGRPKLGVVAREVTLLPRQWDWLASQPGGASVTLRRLVDEARKAGAEGERALARRDAAYRFMAAVAGNLPGFEEASRALFGGDRERLSSLISTWPPDVAGQVLEMLGDAVQA